jgi:hypothetical protein
VFKRGRRQSFFSVVIASYNSAAWIKHTIRSVLEQTYRNFEVIVVGDGCTDGTEELLKTKFGKRIRWKNLQSNSGSQSAPNNEGVRVARGSHIAYLGHDDIWSRHHLELLDGVVREQDPDFAVSGAVYHGPPGSMFYQITGIFDDPDMVRREFFPPSSFAHKRELTERIGGWRDPNELRPPPDCEFLLRAADHACRFVSTKTISVHKFAAGHRYLSYRFPRGDEQKQLLQRLQASDGDATVLTEIIADLVNGASAPAVKQMDFDQFPPGDLYRGNRHNKGLDHSALLAIEKREVLTIESLPTALDWHELAQHPVHGPFRWSGPNPNPRHFLSIRTTGPVQLRIHVIAFAVEDLAHSLRIDIDDREADFVCERSSDGTYIFSGQFSTGVNDGLALRFRMPRSVPIATDFGTRRAGLALSRVEIMPGRD